MKVYVVTRGDTYAEPWYIACVEIFETKEAAQRCIEDSVKESEQIYDKKASWEGDGTFAMIEFCGRTITYKIEEKEVHT